MAVIQAMAKAARAETRTRPRTSKPSFNYRWEHVTTVVTLSLKLADLVGADREIVEAAAWLHDVTKPDGKKHARIGAAFALVVFQLLNVILAGHLLLKQVFYKRDGFIRAAVINNQDFTADGALINIFGYVI